jgi:hypothetical protein
MKLKLHSIALPLIALAASNVSATTIDIMHTATFGHYSEQFTPGSEFMVFSRADYYLLDDGSTWDAGAGWHPVTYAFLSSISVSGSTITYSFSPPSTGLLFQSTDFNSGYHSAQGQLGLPATLAIVATIGSTVGVMNGYAQIISNEETWYGQPRFNYYSAPVGASVYFEQHFTLLDATFTSDLFSTSFQYNEAGFVDFTNVQPVPEPRTTLLLLVGLTMIGLCAKCKAGLTQYCPDTRNK